MQFAGVYEVQDELVGRAIHSGSVSLFLMIRNSVGGWNEQFVARVLLRDIASGSYTFSDGWTLVTMPVALEREAA